MAEQRRIENLVAVGGNNMKRKPYLPHPASRTIPTTSNYQTIMSSSNDPQAATENISTPSTNPTKEDPLLPMEEKAEHVVSKDAKAAMLGKIRELNPPILPTCTFL